MKQLLFAVVLSFMVSACTHTTSPILHGVDNPYTCTSWREYGGDTILVITVDFPYPRLTRQAQEDSLNAAIVMNPHNWYTCSY